MKLYICIPFLLWVFFLIGWVANLAPGTKMKKRKDCNIYTSTHTKTNTVDIDLLGLYDQQ